MKLQAKIFLLSIALSVAAIYPQAFPKFTAEKPPPRSSAPEWQVVKKVTIEGLNANTYSMKLIPGTHDAIIADDDYFWHRINTETGKVEWSLRQKMLRSRELDGHRIFDVSPDGSEFLTDSQLDENSPSGERSLSRRSTRDGSVIADFKPVASTFYSIEADKDHRYPGKEKAAEHMEGGYGPYWAMTIYAAEYIENGTQILAGYRHNMTGADFYDYKLIVYTKSGKQLNEFQLVADPETANFSQPAGFETGHFTLPYAYHPKRKSIIYGTTHGRVLEVTKGIMVKNAKQPVVEKKPAGVVLFVPISDSPDYQTKDRQTIRSIALSTDGNTIYTVAGDNTYTQIYNYSFKSRKQIFKSEIFTLGGISVLDKNSLAISTSPFMILNLADGGYTFRPEDRDIASAHYAFHPEYQELLAGISYNEFAILRPGAADRTRWLK